MFLSGNYPQWHFAVVLTSKLSELLISVEIIVSLQKYQNAYD